MAVEVVLRPLELEHVPAVWEAIQESRTELGRWMAWCTPDYDEAGVFAFVEIAIEKRLAGAEFDFGIFSTHGEYLGSCGLNCLNDENRFANLGYWIRTSRTRRGFATAAVLELARWGFSQTELNRLEIVVAVENRPSLAVAARAGAVREGTLRKRLIVNGRVHDAAIFSLVRGDPLEIRAASDG